MKAWKVSSIAAATVLGGVLLFTLPSSDSEASVVVTNETISFTLPGQDSLITYPRDAIALRDSQWALDNIQLAFMIAESEGEVINIPPFASDSLIQALTEAVDAALAREDALSSEVQQLSNQLNNRDATISSLREEIGTQEDLIEAQEETITGLQSQVTTLEERLADIGGDAQLYNELTDAIRNLIDRLNRE